MKFKAFLRAGFNFAAETFTDAFRLARNPKEGVKSLYGVSLYRNAVYLMLNSGVTAVLGFVFWIMAARLYSPGDVGLGSALISVAMLLSFIGTLGLGFGIIRFIPETQDKPRLLNSSFTFAGIAGVVVAIIFLAGLPLWSPKLMFVRENPVFLAAFIVFIAAGTLNNILNQTFIGFRKANFTLAQGIINSLSKLLLVVALITFLKAFGIFASWGLAMVVSLIVCLFLFLPQILHRYRPLPSFQRQVTNEMVHFSFGNYISQALWNLPTWILPLIIVNFLSAEANAYFYVAWIMASFLLTISIGTSMSFFAEGSHEEGKLGSDLRKSLKLVALILIPAVAIMFLLGDKLLLLFGSQYSVKGTHLLWLLALAAIPASVNFIYLGIVRIEKKLRELVLIPGAIAFTTLALSYLLLPWLGIIGAGVGWLASQTMVSLVLLPKFRIRLRRS